jgi:hypothetical protein
MNDVNKKNDDSYEADIINQKCDEYSYFLNENEYHIDIEVIQEKVSVFQCRKCKANFFSNNKLHKHVRECHQVKSIVVKTFHVDKSMQESNRIIVFRTKSDLTKSLIFRFWHFVIFFARVFNESLNELCVDFDCTMFLIDRSYLTKILSQTSIHRTDDFVTVRDIETVTHNCFEYVHLKLFIFEFKEIFKLSRQAHVVNNLRTKFLMSMNILKFEEVILDISHRKMILSLCEDSKIDIRITFKLESIKVNRIILIEKLIFISSRIIASISIKMKDKDLFERDYLF